ncbi:MAG: HD domain-containing protein [Treponemataceae bacterium]|nr:HD domain-containing protein [Treponemataceae bacterium]
MLLDNFNFCHAVRDPVWQHIYLTEELYQTCQSAPFKRLQNIRQLGPTIMVYPGASHTRQAHSFGVYNTARKLLQRLLKQGAQNWVSPAGAMSFLAAALWHDAGHFPYTHSLKELPLRDHEDLTADILLAEPVKTLIDKTGADPFQTASIVSHQLPADEETAFLRKLLSGALDPDKLDYLNRDAYYCGVPYGVQDCDFIFSHVFPHKKYGIVLDNQAVMSVEHLLFSKYLMYQAIYWHKNVRIATAMMKKCLFAALQQKQIAPEELYSLDDASIFTLINSRNFAEKAIAEELQNQKLFSIVAETPFNEENQLHDKLQKLEYRSQIEAILAEKGKIAAQNILIDIPESISFECNYKVFDSSGNEQEPKSVFTPETVKAFTGNLRQIRIAVKADTPPSTKNAIAETFASLQ